MPTIVTVTFSPCIDKTTSVKKIFPDKKLQCSPPKLEPGGGGINVARAIKKLGGNAVAIFPSGGIPAKASNTNVFTALYTNNPSTTYVRLAAIPYANFRFIWPLPIEEINNNPTLKTQQNPGW